MFNNVPPTPINVSPIELTGIYVTSCPFDVSFAELVGETIDSDLIAGSNQIDVEECDP